MNTLKKLVILFVMTMFAALIHSPSECHAFVVDSGSCGADATWELDDEGVLNVYGSGDMESYDYTGSSPFYQIRQNIKKLIISDKITAVGKNAFYECNAIESLSIPATAKIGHSAFACSGGMKNLREIKISGTGDMQDMSLYYTVNNTNIDWNYYIDTPWYQANLGGKNYEIEIGEGITSIGEYEFYNCTRATKIKIPTTITNIKKFGFYNCQYAELEGLYIPKTMERINEYSFYNCGKIVELTIPENIKEIDQYAFYGCTALEELSMPATTKIGRYAFTCGGGMKNIRIIRITGKGDMQDLSLNQTVNNANIEWNYYIDTPWYQANLSGKNYEIEIGEGITDIGEYEFYNCSRVTKIKIPTTITNIKKYAFYNCQYAELEGLSIPKTMERINEYSFCNCGKITTLTIPENIKEIDRYAFYNCIAIEDLSIPATAKIGRYAFTCGGGMKNLRMIKITGKGKMQDLSLNATVNNANIEWNYYIDTPWYQANLSGNNFDITVGSGVTGLGENAFYYCVRIKELSLPKTIKSIDNSAFYNCTGISQIYFGGTEKEWNKIDKGENNTILDTASIEFNSTKSGKTDDSGKTEGSDKSEKSDDPDVDDEIGLSETKKTLSLGDKFTLTLENATGSTSWKSSSTKVLTVKKGVVTAVGIGTATITATNNGIKYKCKVTVTGEAGLNYTTATISVGDTLKLKVSGANAVSFTSSKKSVAKVKASGAVIAKKAGKTTIKVKCDNGETYTCKLTVKK